MMPTRGQNGFTLLELLISITLIVLIAGIAVGGVRLGMSTREIGEQKADSYQRLRFIAEQIAIKTSSLHPLFLRPAYGDRALLGMGPDKQPIRPPKFLAFEGQADFLRIVTFASALSMVRKPPWMHEALFYVGPHPRTREEGIIMLERDLAIDDVFTDIRVESAGVRRIMLAKDIVHLRFRYLIVEKLTEEELKLQTDPAIKYKSHWADTHVVTRDEPAPVETTKMSEEEKQLIFAKRNKISLPRAIEISISIKETPVPGRKAAEETLTLPPLLIPLHSGTELFRSTPPEEETPNAST